MEVKINAVELATELADYDVKQVFGEDCVIESEEDSNSLVYTDKAQKLFILKYDHYFNMLTDLSLYTYEQ